MCALFKGASIHIWEIPNQIHELSLYSQNGESSDVSNPEWCLWYLTDSQAEPLGSYHRPFFYSPAIVMRFIRVSFLPQHFPIKKMIIIIIFIDVFLWGRLYYLASYNFYVSIENYFTSYRVDTCCLFLLSVVYKSYMRGKSYSWWWWFPQQQ